MISIVYAYDQPIEGPSQRPRPRRVLTASRWPRGLRRASVDDWLPALAPSPALRLAHFSNRIDDMEYACLYASDLTCRAPQAALAMLEILARSTDLEFLSLRRNLAASHLQVLRRMLLANQNRRREFA